MDFLQETEKDATKIKSMTQKELKDLQEKATKIDPSLGYLLKLFIKASRNGKTLRGLLVKLGFELAGGEVTNDIYKVSASYEIFHTSILIHDDIIDNSKTRRGAATVHETLKPNGKKLAICLGDMGFFLATKILTQTSFNDTLIKEVINYSSKIKIDTVLGEMLDIQKKDPLTVAKLKTACYSVSGSLVLGAKLASGSKELISFLEAFGENLGIAYQIQDDIFGVFGSEKETGKSATSDIEEGKNTLLLSCALKNANSIQKKILETKYGHGKITRTDLEKIRKVFTSTGSLDYAKGEALKYASFAKKMIPKITSEKKYQKILGLFCDYVVERTG